MRAVVVVLLVTAACGDDSVPPVLPEVEDTVALVDPTIGTGGLGFAHGSSFVGAVVPHGLVKLGPDTSGPFGTVNFLHYSGYWAGDDKIRGFSHVHLHGAGATDYGVLSVMPIKAFDAAKTKVTDYESRFTKANEQAAAGLYQVSLASGIEVALTATQRVGVHRYTGAGAVLIDLNKTLESGTIDSASISVDDAAQEISGQLHTRGGMSGGFGGYTLYFVAKAATPWTAHQVWSMGNPPSAAMTAQGTGVGAVLTVPGNFEMAVGISLVSIAGARANLAAEVSTISVDAVAAQARAKWAAILDRVLLTGGTEEERRVFYTSLYHAFLMPSVISDVDGNYQLAGQPVQHATWNQMSDLSLWDTYRTVASLYAWLAPESARDQARSLVGFGEGLGAYPKWPIATGESGTMLGASAEIVIADAVARGITNTGADIAWPRLRAAAMDVATPPGGRGGRGDVVDYMTLGYVPLTGGRSASTTTEYANDDFALAQLAGALGHTADRDTLLVRSRGWRKLYDPAVGFLRGRNADGTFPSAADFDPLDMSEEFAEANAWHSLWMAGIHDHAGLAEVMGGTDAAVAKLEEFFTLAKDDWDNADESAANFPRPYYWHGNEPDINAPFLFTQLGRRDLTSKWAKWVADTMYSDKPEGVAGNDDGGTLGSWYVLAALGLYPVAGSDRWIIAAPRFPQARVRVGGKELLVIAEGLSEQAIYVQSVELDDTVIEGAEITHAQLVGASTLRFVMGTKPQP
ncbi:MAG: glycoside hydrolase family 92 protein [Deltaproteobacteria bacterium]|nr:glycoside hydrolase family 92 protein [Deltaproteobacteria bacterium]